jgi:hypothetical protein
MESLMLHWLVGYHSKQIPIFTLGLFNHGQPKTRSKLGLGKGVGE